MFIANSYQFAIHFLSLSSVTLCTVDGYWPIMIKDNAYSTLCNFFKREVTIVNGVL